MVQTRKTGENLEDKKMMNIQLPDPIGQKRLAKERMQEACNLIHKGARAKTFHKNKELQDAKCAYCRKYKRGKPIPVCQVEEYDMNTGQATIMRKAYCKKAPVKKYENSKRHK